MILFSLEICKRFCIQFGIRVSQLSIKGNLKDHPVMSTLEQSIFSCLVTVLNIRKYKFLFAKDVYLRNHADISRLLKGLQMTQILTFIYQGTDESIKVKKDAPNSNKEQIPFKRQ